MSLFVTILLWVLGIGFVILWLAVTDLYYTSKRQEYLARQYRDEAARCRHPMPYKGE